MRGSIHPDGGTLETQSSELAAKPLVAPFFGENRLSSFSLRKEGRIASEESVKSFPAYSQGRVNDFVRGILGTRITLSTRPLVRSVTKHIRAALTSLALSAPALAGCFACGPEPTRDAGASGGQCLPSDFDPTSPDYTSYRNYREVGPDEPGRAAYARADGGELAFINTQPGNFKERAWLGLQKSQFAGSNPQISDGQGGIFTPRVSGFAPEAISVDCPVKEGGTDYESVPFDRESTLTIPGEYITAVACHDPLSPGQGITCESLASIQTPEGTIITLPPTVPPRTEPGMIHALNHPPVLEQAKAIQAGNTLVIDVNEADNGEGTPLGLTYSVSVNGGAEMQVFPDADGLISVLIPYGSGGEVTLNARDKDTVAAKAFPFIPVTPPTDGGIVDASEPPDANQIEDAGIEDSGLDGGVDHSDAAEPPDASEPPDAAEPPDASESIDASEPPDASLQDLDAGTQTDAAEPIDASEPPDAAEPPDANEPLDASVPSDAAEPPDANEPPDAAEPPDAWVDPCASETCSAHGVCDSTTGAAVCRCDTNWRGAQCETENSPPIFNGETVATPNPTDSATPVAINVPVFDANGDPVTVSLSFIGNSLGCTFDNDSRVIPGGSGTADFVMIPDLLNSGGVTLLETLSDGMGGETTRELIIGIE